MLPEEIDPKDPLSEEDENAVDDTAPVEDDGSPILDEEDLEENDLSEDEAEEVEWDGTEQGAETEDSEDQP
ncbi:hypothetical protein MKQ68_12980 [Chitinophaga horti]|uniref:Uncharacterized protein n=1 Tax=Chitinophaga horti TaxID=2920382 RepID=A0ABY6IYL4_9BACT|nr:hypothetical protein [Chitinophaga horti]UYQ91007.1 hypothetical protein MKQ68_12980 [Chitinophaga horti]